MRSLNIDELVQLYTYLGDLEFLTGGDECNNIDFYAHDIILSDYINNIQQHIINVLGTMTITKINTVRLTKDLEENT